MTCTNKHKRCCYLLLSLSLVYNELRNICLCIATHFLVIFTACKFAILLSQLTYIELFQKTNKYFVILCVFANLVFFIMKSSTFKQKQRGNAGRPEWTSNMQCIVYTSQRAFWRKKAKSSASWPNVYLFYPWQMDLRESTNRRGSWQNSPDRLQMAADCSLEKAMVIRSLKYFQHLWLSAKYLLKQNSMERVMVRFARLTSSMSNSRNLALLWFKVV